MNEMDQLLGKYVTHHKEDIRQTKQKAPHLNGFTDEFWQIVNGRTYTKVFIVSFRRWIILFNSFVEANISLIFIAYGAFQPSKTPVTHAVM